MFEKEDLKIIHTALGFYMEKLETLYQDCTIAERRKQLEDKMDKVNNLERLVCKEMSTK